MKRLLIFSVLVFVSLQATAQFRMVGLGSWSTVDDSTYTATITFEADLTGMSYLANQIVDTFRMFTPTEQIYQIDSVGSTAFSTAQIWVVEYNGDHGPPIGQVMVYDPAGNETLPQAPFGSTGSTAQLQAAVDTYNQRILSAEVDAGAGGGGGGATVSYDALTSGTVTAAVTRLGGTSTSITNPASGEYNITIPSGADIKAVQVYGNNSTLNGASEFILRLNNSANSRDVRAIIQLIDNNSNALVDQQATATVHTLVVSGNISTFTFPGMNGFGSSGFYILIQL